MKDKRIEIDNHFVIEIIENIFHEVRLSSYPMVIVIRFKLLIEYRLVIIVINISIIIILWDVYSLYFYKTFKYSEYLRLAKRKELRILCTFRWKRKVKDKRIEMDSHFIIEIIENIFHEVRLSLYPGTIVIYFNILLLLIEYCLLIIIISISIIINPLKYL